MEINFYNQVWTITKVPAHDPKLQVDGVTCKGAAWFAPQEIALSDELTTINAKATIVHELVHAALYATQVDPPAKFDEEYLCNFVAMYGAGILSTAENIYQELYMK